jgi:protease-4
MKKNSISAVLAILGIAVIFLGMVMIVTLFFINSSSGFSFSNKIGVIQINGAIKDSWPIVSQLAAFKKDKGIKAIILRINSPGGGVGASQEIYSEVLRTRKTKRVIVSLGSVAASGGYYIASAGDKIIANPGTITGSIGVLMEFIRVQELFKKIGLGMEVLKSGEFKDTGSPHRELTEREKEILKALILEIQEQFINAVAKGRGIPVEKVREIADGRIISGAMAKELGLIDRLGNFQDAVDLTKKISGISGEVSLVYPKKKRIGLWDVLFRNAAMSLYKVVGDISNTNLEYRWDGFSHPLD